MEALLVVKASVVYLTFQEGDLSTMLFPFEEYSDDPLSERVVLVAFWMPRRREDCLWGVGASASRWRSLVDRCGGGLSGRPFVDRCGRLSGGLFADGCRRLSGRFGGFRTAFCCSIRHSSPP
jgi:hypothetical protein